MTRHQLSISVLLTLLPAKPLATAVTPISFALPYQEGGDFIMGVPGYLTWVSYISIFPFPLETLKNLR